MEQIKVKELPVGYFVDDIYYPSGNKEFVGKEMTSKELCDYCIGFPATNNKTNETINEWNHHEVPCIRNPRKIFGTKHIQLVAVNIKDYSETDGYNDRPLTNGDMYFNSGGYSNWNSIMPKKEYEKAQSFIKQGKDFFIYKVSDEK